MKTYWDYSDKEKAKLTQEEVKSLLDVELMTKGVKKVEAPVLKEIKPVKVAKDLWFEVENIYFKTAEQAQSFLALNPMKSAYDYSVGYDYKYSQEFEQTIKQQELFNRQEVLNLKTVLKENTEAKNHNEKAVSDYEKQVKEQDKILNGVWEDWWRCKERAAELQKVIDTKTEYLRMTDNNEELALSFLKKVFTEEDINEALEII